MCCLDRSFLQATAQQPERRVSVSVQLHLDMSAFETLCGPCTVYMSVYKSFRAVPGRVVQPHLEVPG
jgi:hypothetical protein